MSDADDVGRGKEWVAIVLAIGLATAINLITFAVFYDAVISQESGLSENSTQVLTTAFGGIIGVLGGFIGYQAGRRNRDTTTTTPPPEDHDAPTPG